MKRFFVLVLVLSNATAVHAITDQEIVPAIQFSFANPGARSLGMGGAFVGRADDATAAYTNPAGLTQLRDMEVSLEGRRTEYTSTYVNGGTFQLSPFDPSGLTYGEAESSENGLAFASFVYPRERWAVAVFRHELTRLETDFFAIDGPVARDDATLAILPYGGLIELDIVNVGASLAFEASEALSLGLTVLRSEIDYSAVTVYPTAGTSFGTASESDDATWAFGAGLTWRASEHWQFGAVYRDGPEFDAEALLFGLDATGNPTFLANGFPKPIDFTVPDVLGFGVSWHPNDAWVVGLDINRIQYSDLTDGMTSAFRASDTTDPQSTEPLDVDDGTEVRLGAEYAFLDMQNVVSVRAGVWYDPEHTIRFRGPPDPSPASNAVSNAVLFSSGDDEIHYAVGAGIAFARFQLDFGADFSDIGDIYSLSGIVRF